MSAAKAVETVSAEAVAAKPPSTRLGVGPARRAVAAAAAINGAGAAFVPWLGPGDTGDHPAAAPRAWTILAASRREFGAAATTAAAVSPPSAAKTDRQPGGFLGILFGDGIAEHPNAGVLLGNGYTWSGSGGECTNGSCDFGSAGIGGRRGSGSAGGGANDVNGTNWTGVAGLAARSGSGNRAAGSVAQAASIVSDAVEPTLILNGYAVVPATRLNVTSYYGMYSTAPSTKGSAQGRQRFNLVDQETGDIVGEFGAFVLQNNSYGSHYNKVHTELLVTDVVSGTVGTDPGQIPPRFSRIGAIGDGTRGTVYSAMPQYGSAVVRWALLTRLFKVPLPRFYNATQGFADDGEVNQPFSLGNGYAIGPANPEIPWLTTAIAGVSPGYTVEQGIQEFRIYDAATGVTVGTFDGLTTPTKDIVGIHTLAILVGDTHGSTNVGTQAGQVPPSGTVYTLIYVRNLRTYELYSSMPSPDGVVSSVKLVTPRRTLSLPIRFDAATPPTPGPLQVPGGYTLVPTSPLEVTGLNGLSPLQVLYQGYQQYDVVDPAGTKIGSIDADVSYQSNGVGPGSVWSAGNTGLLVTRITAGIAGTGSGDVPAVGSVFNSKQSLAPGFRLFYSALASPTGNVITSKLVTPWGAIRMPTKYDAAAGLADATYYDPLLRPPA